MAEDDIVREIAALTAQTEKLADELRRRTMAKLATAQKMNTLNIPPGWISDFVQKGKKTDAEWNGKTGNNEDGGRHLCTLLVNVDNAGNFLSISPDEPHAHVRKAEKRTLIWELDLESVLDGWRFAEDATLNVRPMKVGWETAAQKVDLTTVGAREVIYTMGARSTRLKAWFNPAANAVPRSLRYELYVYNNKTGNVATTYPFDPIIESEGGF